jgi:hypothetical protein
LSEPIKNLLNAFNIWKKQRVRKTIMDMTLAEMDFFGKRRSFWQKKRIRKNFNFQILKSGKMKLLARGIRKFNFQILKLGKAKLLARGIRKF